MGHVGTDAMVRSCVCLLRSEWKEAQRTEWLLQELTGKRPLLPPGLQCTPEVAEVLSTFRILAELPPDSLGAYVISMAHTASDVLAVVLLQVQPRPAHAALHACTCMPGRDAYSPCAQHCSWLSPRCHWKLSSPMHSMHVTCCSQSVSRRLSN